MSDDTRIEYWKSRLDSAIGRLPLDQRYAKLAALVMQLEAVRTGQTIELSIPKPSLTPRQHFAAALTALRRKNQSNTSSKRLKKKKI